MIFADLFFLYFFMALCFIAYFICRKTVYRNWVLIVFSMIFYAWGEPVWVFLLIGSVTVNYVGGLLIDKFRDTKKATAVTACTLVFDIGLLVFFKYTGFLVENFNAISPVDLPVPHIEMPIGISFFTFQIISYILDCYWGKIKVQRSWYKLLMYISMFPQLVAGPIVRYAVIENEIDNRVITSADVSEGITRICMGLGKKVILANNLSTIVDTFFKTGDLASLSVVGTWYMVIVYAMQVYFDFSGYSDIAIGLGRIFGFHFDENFRYPFVSKNITEFWQRWHISLGTFFRDYLLYVPIFGKRRKYLNLFLVWFCTGFWHGANWNFMLWGVYFGVILLCEKLFLGKALKKIPAFFQHLYALLFIVIGWGIFSYEDFGKLTQNFKNMFGAGGLPLINHQTVFWLAQYAVTIVILVIASTQIPKKLCLKLQIKCPEICGCILQPLFALTLLAVSTAYLAGNSFNPFLYFRF